VSEESDDDDEGGDTDVDDGYVVAVKPSARKSNGAVGRWVNRNGPTRRFPSKAHAREWARDCAGPGAFVWIQDAVPGRQRDGRLPRRWFPVAESGGDAARDQATLEDR